MSRGPATLAEGVEVENVSPDWWRLADLLASRRTLVLTGAGVSTESGIPDYRGSETRRRVRNPMRFADYVRDDLSRARYWARSMRGWERFSAARPNAGHRALAELERQGRWSGLVTQNVDRLHQAAGHRDVLELHGALHDVRCLACGAIESRASLQHRLVVLNPWVVDDAGKDAPDGDADVEIERDELARFVVPECLACGGMLKPDVVFFGEAVPRERVERSHDLLEASDALLVVGSSLAVFSGFRFVRWAASRGLPIAIVTLGPSRGDVYASLRIEARTGAILPWLAATLGEASARDGGLDDASLKFSERA